MKVDSMGRGFLGGSNSDESVVRISPYRALYDLLIRILTQSRKIINKQGQSSDSKVLLQEILRGFAGRHDVPLKMLVYKAIAILEKIGLAKDEESPFLPQGNPLHKRQRKLL